MSNLVTVMALNILSAVLLLLLRAFPGNMSILVTIVAFNLSLAASSFRAGVGNVSVFVAVVAFDISFAVVLLGFSAVVGDMSLLSAVIAFQSLL